MQCSISLHNPRRLKAAFTHTHTQPSNLPLHVIFINAKEQVMF